jgi:hypothetical protein
MLLPITYLLHRVYMPAFDQHAALDAYIEELKIQIKKIKEPGKKNGERI